MKKVIIFYSLLVFSFSFILAEDAFAAPLAPAGLSPSGYNISLPVVLKWQPAQGATKYRYQFSKTNDYTGQAISETPNTQVSLMLEYNTPYRWRVQSCATDEFTNIDDCSNWAEQVFTTAAMSGGSVTSPGTTGGGIPIPNPLKVDTFEGLLNAIINFIFWVGLALAPVMFIVAGLLYVTSAGNPQKVESAKKMMIYTVIGLVVLLLARGLVKVLELVIGVK